MNLSVLDEIKRLLQNFVDYAKFLSFFVGFSAMYGKD